MNVISISGNTTKDMEIRYLPDGSAVGSFSVADNMGKDKGAMFWNCSWFGKRAEGIAQYMLKGTPVTVNGSLSEREYTNKDGNKVKTMEVRVNDVALQGGKRDAGEALYQAPREMPTRAPALKPAGGFDDMDSDVPY